MLVSLMSIIKTGSWFIDALGGNYEGNSSYHHHIFVNKSTSEIDDGNSSYLHSSSIPSEMAYLL